MTSFPETCGFLSDVNILSWFLHKPQLPLFPLTYGSKLHFVEMQAYNLEHTVLNK
jgi:hypothetical protein